MIGAVPPVPHVMVGIGTTVPLPLQLFIDACITKSMLFGHSNVVPISKYTMTHFLKFRGDIQS
jgi:hypothetical protein